MLQQRNLNPSAYQGSFMSAVWGIIMVLIYSLDTVFCILYNYAYSWAISVFITAQYSPQCRIQ